MPVTEDYLGATRVRHGEWIATFHWGLTDSGIDCIRLEVDVHSFENGVPKAVPKAVLRSFPEAALREYARLNLVPELPRVKALAEGLESARGHVQRHIGRPIQKNKLQRQAESRRRTRGRPSDYADAHYQVVAEVYREAGRNKRPKINAVQEWAKVSRSTAVNWIREARKRDLLSG